MVHASAPRTSCYAVAAIRLRSDQKNREEEAERYRSRNIRLGPGRNGVRFDDRLDEENITDGRLNQLHANQGGSLIKRIGINQAALR